MNSDMADTVAGVLIWALVLYPVWSPRCRRIRKRQREAEREQQKPASATRSTARLNKMTGPAWEQDVPYALDLEMEDDL